MADLIRNQYQIIAVIALVLVIVAARIVNAALAGRRKMAEGRRIVLWKETLDRLSGDDSLRLTKREIARFSDSGMLKAFAFLSENGEGASCAKVLFRNGTAIVSRVEAYADPAEKGFFAYIVSRSDRSGWTDETKEPYRSFARALVRDDSVYCRENALKMLYAFGDPDAVIDAFQTLSHDGRLHNEKLLADGLASYTGDRDALVSALAEAFERFDDHTQSAVITYFTTVGYHGRDAFFRERLDDGSVSVDQRCDILRLLIKDPSEETKRILIAVLRGNRNAEEWQTAAVAANGLAEYPGDDDVIRALMKGITSPSWDVRVNSASSLVKLHAPEHVLLDIRNGADRYAADALLYALSSAEREETE